MISFQLPPSGVAPLRLLAVGAHADDIEIGCGGTILRLLEEGVPLHVHWVVLSGDGPRGEEAQQSAESFLRGAAEARIVVGDFRDGFFPYTGPPIKEFFEELKPEVEPDLILTHSRDDLHQDHRLVCELTWNTFRNHLVFEYEVPKYDGDLGSPNVFVRLSEATCLRKADLLLEHFASQRYKHWFSRDAFLALCRLRGVEAASPTGYAEAFTCRKLSF